MISLEDLTKALRPHADAYAAFYGGPVYLVGSALDGHLHGDVDLRVVIPADDYDRLFRQFFDATDNTAVWRQRYEELKQSRRLSRAIGLRVDFQFQRTAGAERYADRPRLRLDSTPDWLWRAGMESA